MPLTEAELKQYEEQGAVVVDSPLTTAELDRAEAAWDRLTASGRPPYEDPDYMDVFQHPYFEEMAMEVLRADAVHLWWGLSPPRPFSDQSALREPARPMGRRMPHRHSGHVGGLPGDAPQDARGTLVLAQRRAGAPRGHAHTTRKSPPDYGILEPRPDAGSQGNAAPRAWGAPGSA